MSRFGERLESVTQETMRKGANAALLMKANGEPEVIQFHDLTRNPDGSFTLTGLLRGRRGTDVCSLGHQPGQLFVLLDPADIRTLLVPLDEPGLPRSCRAVGFGSLFEDAETVVQSHDGRDLMSLAPVHVAGSRNDDFPGDLRISTLMPTADTAQKDWSPSSGSDTFSRVAEIPPDDDRGRVASATPGDRDLYTMAPLGMAPLGVTPLAIRGLQPTALARKDDAGDRAWSLVLASGAKVEVSPTVTLGCGCAFLETMHEQDAATGAPWTPAAVNTIQAGLEVAP